MSEKQNRQNGKIVSKLRWGSLTAMLWANPSEYDQELPDGQEKRRDSRVAAAGISIVVVDVVAGSAYVLWLFELPGLAALLVTAVVMFVGLCIGEEEGPEWQQTRRMSRRAAAAISVGVASIVTGSIYLLVLFEMPGWAAVILALVVFFGAMCGQGKPTPLT